MELRYPLVLDGATGTQLQKRGFTGAECAEKWILEHPETILEVQRAYVTAGSQILYAPTFGANPLKLAQHGLEDRTEEYNLRLVELARQAAGGKALVAGDMSPSGKFLAPMGELSFEELTAAYARQAAALEQAGVDLYVIETMMTLADARAAVLAVRSVSDKPIFVTFTCDGSGRTLTGTDVTAALTVMEGMGVTAFGLNCSAGPEEMLAQLKRLGEITSIPLIAKPNAGLPQMMDGKTVYCCPPEEFTAYVENMAAVGVMAFGGCCGTEESHIAALKEKLASVTVEEKKGRARLLCATERDVFPVDMEGDFLEPLTCDDDLGENIEDAQEDEEGILVVALSEEEELEYFAECQWQIRLPLCFLCEDASLLEKALRLYQGRALYRGGLEENILRPLAEKYGLIY